MKLLSSLLFVLLFSFSTNAQNYAPFPVDSARWGQSQFFVGLGFDGWANCSYVQNGDTVLDDLNYTKIYLDATEYWSAENPPAEIFYVGAMREDSLKKVFFRPHESLITFDESFYNNVFFSDLQLPKFPSGTTEYLLYDFSNIAIGDTISYPSHHTFLDYSYTVIDTAQFNIGGVNRKAYQIECSNLSIHDYAGHCIDYFDDSPHYLIEGIGSSRGLLGVYHRYNEINSISALICFNGEEVIQNWEGEDNVYPLTSIDECGLNSGNSVEAFNSILEISFFPNPTTNQLTLSSDSRIETISILNSLSEELKEIGVVGTKSTIEVADLESGIYFIIVNLENGQNVSKKFIKN